MKQPCLYKSASGAVLESCQSAVPCAQCHVIIGYVRGCHATNVEPLWSRCVLIWCKWHFLQDNDIILCDGPCNRAYHEKCLDPPQNTAELPEDAPWLCPACSTKVPHVIDCGS